MDCGDMGYMIIYDRDGHFITVDHKRTVELCNRSVEEGIGIADIIKREIVHNLKLIKFMQDSDDEK